MRKLVILKAFLLLGSGSLTGYGTVSPFSDLSAIRRAFIEDHRIFEKVIEGKSEWHSTFCQGVYSYRVILRTQLKDLDIQLAQDGSISLKAVLHEPYVGFQGNYQGAYSFCFPVSNWSGLTAESATIDAQIQFADAEDGRIKVNVKVSSVELGTLMTDNLSQSWEEKMTGLLNSGLSQVWSSQLGDWFSSQISSVINQHLPTVPKES